MYAATLVRRASIFDGLSFDPLALFDENRGLSMHRTAADVAHGVGMDVVGLSS